MCKKVAEMCMLVCTLIVCMQQNQIFHDMCQYMRGSRGGGQGVLPSPPPGKVIGFHSNTGPDPLKITKLPSQHSMLGHHRRASESPLKWPFGGGSIMARLKWYLDPPYQTKKQTNKKPRQSWTPSDNTFWICECQY